MRQKFLWNLDRCWAASCYKTDRIWPVCYDWFIVAIVKIPTNTMNAHHTILDHRLWYTSRVTVRFQLISELRHELCYQEPIEFLWFRQHPIKPQHCLHAAKIKTAVQVRSLQTKNVRNTWRKYVNLMKQSVNTCDLYDWVWHENIFSFLMNPIINK